MKQKHCLLRPLMTRESPMYIYATEMVSEYYSGLNMKGKKVLTITGSGDQVINAYFFGASKVVGFDICARAFFMLDIKASAINKLTYFEFIKFFGSDMSNGSFDFNLYNKLKGGLSPKTRRFFNQAYKDFKNDGKKLIESDYFRQRSTIEVSPFDINSYLKNEKTYIKCRAIIKGKQLQFLELDVADILTNRKLKGKFDIINLSNVPNYLTANSTKKQVLDILKDTAKKVVKKINDGGLFFYYSYFLPREKRNIRHAYGFVSSKTPYASQLSIINIIKKTSTLKVYFKKINGVNTGTFDRINIFSQ
jgi:hypothetical protein